MSIARHHAEWLSLVEVSGPFLSMPVLLRVFPQGLDAHDPAVSRAVRRAHEEWQDNQQGLRPDPAIHTAWVRFVLREVLGFPDELIWGSGIGDRGSASTSPATGRFQLSQVAVSMAEHGEVLRPDLVIGRLQSDPMPDTPYPTPRLLVQIVPPAQDLDKPLRDRRWKASPATRMAELLRGAGVRLGLLTNGERWMLVHAQSGETAGFASWYAALWLEEPVTLRAFRSLLSVDRLYGVADADTLEALLTESAANQQEVTDQLGYQVREAVEVLVQTLDRIDKDGGRKLLAGVSEATLYEAALTVMMRLVFLFSAEERELLLLGKPMYDQHYAVSTLRAQLRAAADETGEEVLERRHDAWSRLLATFRAVFGGVQHEDLRLPAYGGALFDPDRFPFLEGRSLGIGDRGSGIGSDRTAAQPIPDPRSPIPRPLPVDNRTVLHLLEALQILRIAVPGGGPAEPRRLSFRALDIEQIGHVYEGLLDHTARRAAEPMLGLAGGKDREPEVALAALEKLYGDQGSGARDRGATTPMQASLFTEAPAAGADADPRSPIPDPLLRFLREETGRSPGALEKALGAALEPRDLDALRAACDNDAALVARVRPFAGLLRRDSFGRPVVITAGSVYVTAGTDRRSSGTHYTPRSLTEPIVQHTLDPLVYHGPAEGLPKEQWALHPAERILALQVCDMAMGSGAFLVQACRYLSERLVEAWELYGDRGSGIGDRTAGRKGSTDGNPDLSRSGSLAAEHGSRRGGVSADPAVPEGGAVRADQPDPAGGRVGSGEHRGGLWADSSQGVYSSPLDSAGFPVGGRDAAPTGSTPDLRGAGTGSEALGATPGGGPTPEWSAAFPRGEGRQGAIADPRSPDPDPRSPIPDPLPADPEERLAIARQLVADRCLYGVDKNPLAVEMAKLSLWLITLQKDRPFSFLDHALRAGDSLLGIADIDQLLRWSLAQASGPTTATFLTEPLRRVLGRAIALRRRIRETPVIDVRDAERKAGWLREAEEVLGLVRLAADLLVAAALHPDKKRREELSDEFQYRMSLAAEAWESVRRDPTLRPDANQEELAALRREADALLDGRRPFHWPLEFPEVFLWDRGSGIGGGRDQESGIGDRGSGFDEMLEDVRVGVADPPSLIPDPQPGFAAIVGNPPFQGGKKITGALGIPYRDYLVDVLASGKSGIADLCAYFFLRASSSLCDLGQMGLIATNTIAQGDSREVGLEQITLSNYSIMRAISSAKWPGLAAVEVAHVWVRRGEWQGSYVLDGLDVPGITSYLAPTGNVSGNPRRLMANDGKSFIGSIVLGMGFVLEPEQARVLIEKDVRNKEILFPFLNGEDLNSRPDQSARRWVINFQELSLEVAENYHDAMSIVREKVKPERGLNNRKAYRERWWQFAEKQMALYEAIKNQRRVLVLAIISRTVAFVFVPVNQVYSHKLVGFAFDKASYFAALQSSFHYYWAWQYSSTMKSDLNYSPTDCFQTFPFPWKEGPEPDPRSPIPDPLDAIGEAYHAHRKALMADRGEGLTKTYNRFHSPDERSEDIAELRRLHVAMDQAVAAAYGWGDLDLGHGFHQTKQGLRYTISEAARRTVLDRLLALNHQRYAEEVAEGLHDRKGSGARGQGSGKGGRKRKGGAEPQTPNPEPSVEQGELF